MSYILETEHLTKTIHGREIVKDVNIHVKKGEIYGFLGPNGAGKTTVMKMITNLWKPSSGSIRLFYETLTPSSYEVLKRMGSIIEFPAFYEHLSGRENLKLHCEYMGYYHPGCVEDALKLLELGNAADQPVKNYSLGMKQRLGISRAVLCRPELLVLDEPANGLDPAGIKRIRDLFRDLCREYGITIFVSTHILSEVESIADTIGIIHQGKLLQEISMKEIEEKTMAYIELSVSDTRKAAFLLSDRMGMENFRVLDDHRIRIYDAQAVPEDVTRLLTGEGVKIKAIGRRAESLEEYFLKMTGEGTEIC